MGKLRRFFTMSKSARTWLLLTGIAFVLIATYFGTHGLDFFALSFYGLALGIIVYALISLVFEGDDVAREVYPDLFAGLDAEKAIKRAKHSSKRPRS